MKEIVKVFLIPGSVSFLLSGLFLGLLLLHLGPRCASWGRRWLLALGLVYAMLSTPIVSNALIEKWETGSTPIEAASAAARPRTVVVIGAGIVSYSANGRSIHAMGRRTAHSVIEAARVYQLTTAPWVIASGGIADPLTQTAPESEVMRDELVRLGVPPDRILLESESRNTEEQVVNVARMVRERQLPNPVIFVTTPAHSRRVMLLARRHEVDALPSLTTDLHYGDYGWRAWFPSDHALRGSESTTYEFLAAVQAWLWR